MNAAVSPVPLKGLLRAALFLLALGAAASAHAQIKVNVDLPRMLFIAHEPIMINVKITNMSGRPMMLHDVGGQKWLGFEITTFAGDLISPTNPNYKLDPVEIGPAQSIRRKINLTPLYRLAEYGRYKVRANVWVADNDSFFSSPGLVIDVTEGKVIWTETVGVPSGEGTRTISLLQHRTVQDAQLYARVEDKEHGVVYTTVKLGRMLSFAKPSIRLDSANTVHVLQMIAPKSYIYSHIGLDGEILERQALLESDTAPRLRTSNGQIILVGGSIDEGTSPNAPAPDAPKLTDRPVPIDAAERENLERLKKPSKVPKPEKIPQQQ